MCTIYRPEEISDKWQQVKSYLKICHYQKSQTSTLLLKKSKIVQIEMYNLQTRPVKFKDQKKLKVYSIVKIELSLNENKFNVHKYQECLSFWKCLKYVL